MANLTTSSKTQTEIWRYTEDYAAYYYYSDTWKSRLLEELEQIPYTEEKIVFRNISTKRLPEEIQEGIWYPKGICSASRSKKIAIDFAEKKRCDSGWKQAIVCIWGRGRYIAPYSAHPYEEEVLFKEGDKFKILYQGEWQGIEIYFAKQI